MWQSIKTWLATLDIILPLDRAKLLFGIHNERCNSILNYIILCAKNFIWKAKFTTKDLSLENFQKYLYYKLTDKRNAYVLMGKECHFKCWINIYLFLSRLPGCTVNDHVAALPEQDQEDTPTAAE